MAEVNWINSNILPTKSGEYYIIVEAQQDIPTMDMEKGDIEITCDYFDVDDGCFQSIGGENPWWKVLNWANVIKPSIPDDLLDKVKLYFSQRVDF